MSTVQVQTEIRQWLDVIISQLGRVDMLLMNDADPVELTAIGEAAYRFLVQARETLERGYTIQGEEVRTTLDLFMLDPRSAFRHRALRQPAPRSREMGDRHTAGNLQLVSNGYPNTFPSNEAGSQTNNPGYVYPLLPPG